MHRFDPSLDRFAADVFAAARNRCAEDGCTLGLPLTKAELDAAAGETITPLGLGRDEVLQLFSEIVEPACLSTDFPRYLAFVPQAPSEIAILADLLVSSACIYAGSWMEGAGAVWAENQALRWLADLAGLPPAAGGCFVSGGTNGNLSALVAARARTRAPANGRRVLVSGPTAHSSVAAVAMVMDVDVVTVPGERLTGDNLAPVLVEVRDRAFAVVATAGSTNLGLVDDLASVSTVCRDAGVWLHVDGAYGGAALAAPSVRARFDGIENVDSLVIDPHKWLFAPFDVCALLYRDPGQARTVHAHHASYLDILTDSGDWNPSDFAIHLTRRARGLPFWFSLAAHGTDAYRDAIETCLATARAAADLVRSADHLELVCEPELSVVAFTRTGWDVDDYRTWSEAMLTSGRAMVVPSAHDGQTILRICIVNPRTTVDDVGMLVESLR